MYGTYIYLYLPLKNQLNVGKIIPDMDPMGPCWLKMTEKMAEVLLHSSESMTVLAR